jgi:hypothetical protein
VGLQQSKPAPSPPSISGPVDASSSSTAGERLNLVFKKHRRVHAWKNDLLQCDLIVSVLYKPTYLTDVNTIWMITVDAQEQQSPSEKVIITRLRSHRNPLPLRAWCTPHLVS